MIVITNGEYPDETAIGMLNMFLSNEDSRDGRRSIIASMDSMTTHKCKFLPEVDDVILTRDGGQAIPSLNHVGTKEYESILNNEDMSVVGNTIYKQGQNYSQSSFQDNQ